MPTVATQLGPLSCHVFQQSAQPPQAAVVLCHGFGAPGDDLAALGEELVRADPSLDRIRFVFPEAPLSLADLGLPGGRAWWMLDMDQVAAVQRGDTSRLEQMRERVPEGLPAARRALMAALDALTRSAELPYGRVVLGGFSQGAMLATDVSLRLEEVPAGLVVLSGTLIAKTEWGRRAPSRKGLPVVQAHGLSDPVLPYFNAVALKDLFTAAGLEVDFHPFDGGHTIPPEALAAVIRLIRDVAQNTRWS